MCETKSKPSDLGFQINDIGTKVQISIAVSVSSFFPTISIPVSISSCFMLYTIFKEEDNAARYDGCQFPPLVIKFRDISADSAEHSHYWQGRLGKTA